ncbi:metallophosphoesterase family protein [Anaerococcus sp. AGMB00486]|uniref:Metallophosphoesterase family protein n=1 Tax=Anaerococcus faecalis TaxID=2742993 RepID=A0ABX2N793_9FIRM|nr:metallophosphoesterase [Anaerococcus faecalis]NVF10540.1 metallophosphoesterase family protein [Anaerococcus faecalis]
MKFINLSDVHLSDSFDFESSYSNIIRRSKWDSFKDILESNKDVDFALISGDLYERDYFMSKDYDRLFRIIENFGKNIYYVTGNHDYIDRKNDFFFENKPQNLYIFGSERIEFYEYKNVRIYGISYDDRIFSKRFNYSINLNKNYYNIGIFHGEITNINSTYLSLDLERLKKIGFNYVGLGHIHKKTNFNNNIYYVGSIEPQSFKDKGEFGYIKYDNGDFFFKESSKLEFLELNEDLSDYRNMDHMIDSIRDMFKGDYVFLRLKLDNYDLFDINEKKLRKELDLIYIELVYKKSLSYYNDLIKKYPNTILQDFYDSLLSLDEDEKVKERALEIGIDAILRSRDV